MNREAQRPADDAVEFTILMPCLNEAETVGRCVDKALACLERLALSGEVVVADNGSRDGSQAIARRHGARVVDVAVRGYGAALYHGSLAARGRYIIMGDADDSYDFSSLEPFVDELRQGRDLVMGNRFRGRIHPGAMPFKNRYFGNPVLSGLGRLFFHCPVRDFHCGLRGYRRDAFQRMSLQTTGMEFASEMVIKATLLGMNICEVPTELHKDGRGRAPHLRAWHDGWRHLRFMLMYSPRWLFFYPGILLMLIGVVLGGWLLRGPIELTSGVRLDVHTLLFAAAAVMVGFQAVVFSICARVLAQAEGFVPEDLRLSRLVSHLSLEAGVAVGAALFFAGVLAAAGSVVTWSHHHYGALDPVTMLRAAIPSVTALTLGCQIVFSSFFLSLLLLHKRR